jgi:hypothetical protein
MDLSFIGIWIIFPGKKPDRITSPGPCSSVTKKLLPVNSLFNPERKPPFIFV